MKGLKVFIVDDEPLMRLSMVDALEGVGCEVSAAATGTEGVYVLEKRQFDLVITDLRLPGADGLAILKACKERNPHTEVILITAHGSVDTAVGAMKFGAYDYITKPFQMDELLLIVERVGRVLGLRRENVELKEVSEDSFSFGGMLGRDVQMRAVIESIKKIAATDSTVLVTGESGTGKELIANAIHLNSPRKDRPVIRVSCAALPEMSLEAALFGHEKGVFTGALRRRRGRFELANKGTLFLDEIGAITPLVQVKLLRVLQERRFERVGGDATIEVDVRVVCATQKDLKKEVGQGRFREDLFERLSVVQVTIPPLRDRRDDTLLIAESVLQTRSVKLGKNLKGFSQPARELLLRYSFPGNVRELENMVGKAVALGREGEEVQPWELCGCQVCPYLGGPPQESCGFCSEGLSVKRTKSRDATRISLAAAGEQFERDYIIDVLDNAEGNRTIAADMLGLSRKALWEKCERYGIPSAKDDPEGEEN